MPGRGRFDFLATVLPDPVRYPGAAPDHLDEDHHPVRSGAVGGLNETLLAKAVDSKLLRTDKVRADTTVVTAAVAYPTDSGLLAKAVGSVARTITRIHRAGGATRTRVRDRSRSAGRRAPTDYRGADD